MKLILKNCTSKKNGKDYSYLEIRTDKDTLICTYFLKDLEKKLIEYEG